MDQPLSKNTNYVFTFGNLGVGKSTLLAGMCTYMQDSPHVKFRKDVIGNQKGIRLLMNDWMAALKSKKYPPQSRKGQILSINVGIQPIGNKEIKPITFLEMSGEDLRDIDIRISTEGEEEKFKEFQKQFVNYLKVTSICLIATSIETAAEDDLLIDQFFEWLERYKVKAPIGLVITKWDKLESNIQVSDFIQNNMPASTKWIKYNNIGEANIFKFSIGETDSDNNITNLNLEDSASLVKWFGDIFYEKKL